MHICMCLHVSVHNIMCSARARSIIIAVLDWYGPEADPVYILVKEEGGGGRTPGSHAKHTFKGGVGHPPEKYWGI